MINESKAKIDEVEDQLEAASAGQAFKRVVIVTLIAIVAALLVLSALLLVLIK